MMAISSHRRPWFGPDLDRPKWEDASLRTLCYQLDASEDEADLGVERLFFILNSHFDPQWVTLPSLESGRVWHRAIDTNLSSGDDFAEPGRELFIDPADHYRLPTRAARWCCLPRSLG